jgi:hypothetical protein
MLAELHRQERRDRTSPIGQSDSSRQAAILRDIARLRNSTDSQTGVGIGGRSCVELCRGRRSFIDNGSCAATRTKVIDGSLTPLEKYYVFPEVAKIDSASGSVFFATISPCV